MTLMRYSYSWSLAGELGISLSTSFESTKMTSLSRQSIPQHTPFSLQDRRANFQNLSGGLWRVYTPSLPLLTVTLSELGLKKVFFSSLPEVALGWWPFYCLFLPDLFPFFQLLDTSQVWFARLPGRWSNLAWLAPQGWRGTAQPPGRLTWRLIRRQRCRYRYICKYSCKYRCRHINRSRCSYRWRCWFRCCGGGISCTCAQEEAHFSPHQTCPRAHTCELV